MSVNYGSGTDAKPAVLFDGDGAIDETNPLEVKSTLPEGAATDATLATLATEATLADIKAQTDKLNFDGTKLKVDATLSGTLTITEVHLTDAVTDEPAIIDGDGALLVKQATQPLPTGAATAAKQPALGTAGTPSADVLTVQGVASMTALKVDGSGVTQPVSGTVTANAGTNLNTSALATSALQTNGAQKAQIVDGDGNVPAVVTGANTGVKGLRVFGGPTDPTSDVPVHIEFNHHQNHESEAFVWSLKTSLAQNVARHVRISVPTIANATRTPHIMIEVMATEITDVVLYEGTTWTAGGTQETTVCRNRNAPGTAGMKIYITGGTALTVNAQGTAITNWFLSPAKVATTVNETSEWILKSATEYDLAITSTNNASCLIRLNWYEDQGV